MMKIKHITEQIKESVDQFIDSVVDTESLINKTIDDMRIRFAEAKELVANAIGELGMLKHAYKDVLESAQVWKNRVDSASQDDDPALISEAQRRLQQHLQRANEIEQQIQVQEAVVDDLKAALHKFNRQFREAKKRAETIAQRQKQAETREEFYKLLTDFDLPDENSAFKQAEQELKETEARAKMWKERNQFSEQQHKSSEKEIDIDETLATLKRDIFGSSQDDSNL